MSHNIPTWTPFVVPLGSSVPYILTKNHKKSVNDLQMGVRYPGLNQNSEVLHDLVDTAAASLADRARGRPKTPGISRSPIHSAKVRTSSGVLHLWTTVFLKRLYVGFHVILNVALFISTLAYGPISISA